MNDLTPYLCVHDARAAIDWYTEVLGAAVVHPPIEMPDGRLGHVELAVAGARWMMAEEFPEIGVGAPDPSRAAVSLHLSVDDVDALAARVSAAGTPLDRGPEDAGPAGRTAVFRDPFGHRWQLVSADRDPADRTHPRADRAEFDRLLADWNRAIVSNDAEAIAAFALPEWIFVGEDGIVPGAQFLEAVAAGRVTHDRMTSEIHDLRVDGDVAVVVARVHNSGTWEGRAFTLEEWSTDVFLARDGHWRCRLTHLTSVGDASR